MSCIFLRNKSCFKFLQTLLLCTAPTAAPQNVTIKRFFDGIFVTWNELTASESRGNPLYVIQYRSAMSGSSPQNVTTAEKFAIIENLMTDVAYTVSVAAAVRESDQLMVGPRSNIIMAPAVPSGKHDRIFKLPN